jgi:hypothetical protein
MIESKNFVNTYWYVPPRYLPAVQASAVPTAHAKAVIDQTVWRFQRCDAGYLTGISATNIGNGWSYNMMIGSITPRGAVKISFSPLESSSGAITIGDGSYDGTDFVMQMTSGSAGLSITHWAHMAQLTPAMPEWRSLPGYDGTGVKDLTGLSTPIL